MCNWYTSFYWFVLLKQESVSGIPVSAVLLQEEAKEVSLSLQDFKSSNG